MTAARIRQGVSSNVTWSYSGDQPDHIQATNLIIFRWPTWSYSGDQPDHIQVTHLIIFKWRTRFLRTDHLRIFGTKGISDDLGLQDLIDLWVASKIDKVQCAWDAFGAEWDDVGCISSDGDGELSHNCSWPSAVRRRMPELEELQEEEEKQEEPLCRRRRMPGGALVLQELQDNQWRLRWLLLSRRRMRAAGTDWGRSVVRAGGQPTWTNLANRDVSLRS